MYITYRNDNITYFILPAVGDIRYRRSGVRIAMYAYKPTKSVMWAVDPFEDGVKKLELRKININI